MKNIIQLVAVTITLLGGGKLTYPAGNAVTKEGINLIVSKVTTKRRGILKKKEVTGQERLGIIPSALVKTWKVT